MVYVNRIDNSNSILAIFILKKLSLKKKKKIPFLFPLLSSVTREREGGREREEKDHSPLGSRKPVSSVTGEDTFYCSNEEDLLTNKIKFTHLCWKYMPLKIILKH